MFLCLFVLLFFKLCWFCGCTFNKCCFWNYCEFCCCYLYCWVYDIVIINNLWCCFVVDNAVVVIVDSFSFWQIYTYFQCLHFKHLSTVSACRGRSSIHQIYVSPKALLSTSLSLQVEIHTYSHINIFVIYKIRTILYGFCLQFLQNHCHLLRNVPRLCFLLLVWL